MTDIKPRRVIAKPQPRNLTNVEKRKLELCQLETRYKSSYKCVSEDEQETVIQLAIVPSDPDFPFDLESLTIQLHVPTSYPAQCCSCQILDIPKELAAHLEKGYVEQFETSPQTLVRQMNWLDRHMETLLQKESTCMEQLSLKTSQLQIDEPAKEEEVEHHNKHKHDDKKKKKSSSSHHKKGKKGKVNYTKVTNKDIREAEKIRKPEFKQIESRFSDTGFKIIKATPRETLAAFVLKIHDPKFKNENLIRGKKLHVQYHISVYYPLVPCSIEIESKNMDQAIADAISSRFNEYVVDNNTTLSDNLTWLSRNVSKLIPEQEQETRNTVRLVGQDLDNIHCTCVSLNVQCNHCQSNVEIQDIQQQKQVECTNCKSVLHAQLVESKNLKAAGYVDLKGCVASNISSFTFTGRCKMCKSDMKDTIQLTAEQTPIKFECSVCQTMISCSFNDLILVK